MSESTVAEIEVLLRWYLEAGVDEAIGERAVDRFVESRPAAPVKPADLLSPGLMPDQFQATTVRRPLSEPVAQVQPGIAAVQNAVTLAQQAATLEDVRAALGTFNACPLSRTATSLVFGDGSPTAEIVFIGEAPGAEEDRQGVPFVGPSGRLLNKMLASISLDRSKVFITNTIFWRPPGNRSPTSTEVAACMPFVERIIEIISPRFLVALGGPAAVALLGQAESVGRLRGRWFTFQTAHMPRPISATALFHPAYLLRSPAQKRLAWRDLLAIKNRIMQK